MKKRRRNPRAAAKAKRATRTHRPEAQPPPLKSQNQIRSWYRFGKKALWCVGAVFGLFSGAVGIWGPIWPTEPSFSLGNPSFGQPLAVPFSVTNTSALFNIFDVTVDCVLIEVITSDNGGGNVIFNSTAIYTNVASSIKPQETRSYTCAFHPTFDKLSLFFGIPSQHKVIKARIGFESKYRIIFGLIEASARSDIFTLDTRTMPPQWTRGAPM